MSVNLHDCHHVKGPVLEGGALGVAFGETRGAETLGTKGDFIALRCQLVPSWAEMANVRGNKPGHGEHLG